MTSREKSDDKGCDCLVQADSRPDGTVRVRIVQDGREIERVVDQSCSTDDLVKIIKFDLNAKDEEKIAEAVRNYISPELPTYSNEPIYKSRHARLWELRKLR